MLFFLSISFIIRSILCTQRIDRAILGDLIFKDKNKRHQLEALVHPRVRAETAKWLYRQRHYKIVCLDIPLLYEGGRERGCDAVLVVSAPAFLQKQRVLRRPMMTEVKFQAILKAQWPDWKKRRRADYVLSTGLGRAGTLRALRLLLPSLHEVTPKAWRPGW